MPAPEEIQERKTGRIVLFPTRVSLGKGKAPKDAGKPDAYDEDLADDLRQYERDAEPDDYSRRMIINAAAFAFIIVLTLSGIWLAEQLALLRKNQDCAFSGRKNCTDINAQIRDR